MLEVSVEKANYYVQCLEEVLDEYEIKNFSRLDKSNLAKRFFEKCEIELNEFKDFVYDFEVDLIEFGIYRKPLNTKVENVLKFVFCLENFKKYGMSYSRVYYDMVCKRYIDGMRVKDIAVLYGTTPSFVSNKINDCFSKRECRSKRRLVDTSPYYNYTLVGDRYVLNAKLQGYPLENIETTFFDSLSSYAQSIFALEWEFRFDYQIREYVISHTKSQMLNKVSNELSKHPNKSICMEIVELAYSMFGEGEQEKIHVLNKDCKFMKALKGSEKDKSALLKYINEYLYSNPIDIKYITELLEG